jgi:signal transduction histidine kinase
VPLRLLKADRLIRNARLIIPAGFILILIAVLTVAIGLLRSRDADMLVVHTLAVRESAQSVLINVKDAEATQRSYYLTGTREYLESFSKAMQAIPTELQKLRNLVSDNPDQHNRIAELSTLIGAKADKLNRTLALIEDNKRDEALITLNSPEGRKLISDIRARVSDVLNAERKLLDERQARATRDRYLLAALIGLALLIATSLAVLLAVASQHAVTGLMQRTRELEAESKLRQEAEETLAQAIKMEAVGQLTGGVAHDFNNLLTIIVGNLDTMKHRLTRIGTSGEMGELRDRLMKPLESALQGAGSAARLTQRLLAFSRRQALEPVLLDMNKMVSGMLDMLRRTLGEQISIETVLAAGLWPTFADAHQLENALLNLALNAKAAMPEGGCLTIETANTYLDDAYVRRFGDVEAGQYAVLCVTDTGIGIPKDIVDRVFEPFFTTKGHGEGSGLGLAMVHGFVKQSGGHVRIYSEDGQGTTVKIYLPRLLNADEMSAAPAAKPDDISPIPRSQRRETILLVEDNDGVRDYARGALEDFGYAVIEAADANQALRLIAKKPTITLLFTDVVLPGSMSGRDLADRVRHKYPGLPVLYTTGYTRNAIVHQGRLDPDVHLLNKPYTQQDLARKVRELIDAAT